MIYANSKLSSNINKKDDSETLHQILSPQPKQPSLKIMCTAFYVPVLRVLNIKQTKTTHRPMFVKFHSTKNEKKIFLKIL